VTSILEMREGIIGDRFRELDRDPFFLTLALCGEVGELANLVKKDWRDLVLKPGQLPSREEEIRDEIADIRVYLELVARCYGIAGKELDARVKRKLTEVAAR
jgi:NTP pyrophosphatase (non-canonical NTP hydrolase)